MLCSLVETWTTSAQSMQTGCGRFQKSFLTKRIHKSILFCWMCLGVTHHTDQSPACAPASFWMHYADKHSSPCQTAHLWAPTHFTDSLLLPAVPIYISSSARGEQADWKVCRAELFKCFFCRKIKTLVVRKADQQSTRHCFISVQEESNAWFASVQMNNYKILLRMLAGANGTETYWPSLLTKRQTPGLLL